MIRKYVENSSKALVSLDPARQRKLSNSRNLKREELDTGDLVNSTVPSLANLAAKYYKAVPSPRLSVADGKFPYIMKLCFSSSRTIPTSFPPSGSASSNSAGNGHVKMQQDSE